MSAITRVNRLTGRLYALFDQLSREEARRAYDAFERYREGSLLNGRRYNSLAWLQTHSAIAQIPEIFTLVSTANDGDRQIAKMASIAIQGVGSSFATRKQGQISTVENTAIRQLGRQSQEADQRKESNERNQSRILDLASSLLRAAYGH